MDLIVGTIGQQQDTHQVKAIKAIFSMLVFNKKDKLNN